MPLGFPYEESMRKSMMCTVLALGFALGGCALFGGNSSVEEEAAPQQAEAAPAPEASAAEEAAKGKTGADKKAKKKAEKKAPSRGAKTEAQIAAELEATGRKLAAQAGRTLVPSKAAKQVSRDGADFVATYVEVDAGQVRTEMRPGTSAGQYVGFVRYQEKFMECRGKSKKDALAAPCRQVKTRNLTELIRYDGKSWHY